MRCIQQAVSSFMENIKAKMNNIHRKPFNITNLIETGSMAEDSKVWPLWEEDSSPELEFDYLAETVWFLPNLSCKTNACPGFTKIKTNDGDGKGWSPKIVNKIFCNNVYRAIVDLCYACCHTYEKDVPSTENDTISIKEVKCLLVESHNHPISNSCTIKKECGRLMFTNYTTNDRHTIRFQWFSTRNSIRCPYINGNKEISFKEVKTINIVVDFLFGLNTTETNTNYIVPKTCDDSNHNGCWKISYCMQEKENIKGSHRTTYMAIKILFSVLLCPDLRDEIVSLSAIASYRIKTAVLTHIKTCEIESTDCLANILTTLSKCIKERQIKHWCADYFLTIPNLDHQKMSDIVLFIAEMLKGYPDDSTCNKQLDIFFRDELHNAIIAVFTETNTELSTDEFCNNLTAIRTAALLLLKRSFE